MSKNKNDNPKKLDLSYYPSPNDNKSFKKNSIRSVVITKEIFEHGPDKKISFNLVRSKRRKTSELIIENENEITLRVPFEKPMEEIKEIIQRKIQWIFKKQDEYKRSKPEIKEYGYLPYSTLPYLGNNYETELRNMGSFKDNIEKVILENNKLLFYLKDMSLETNQDNQFQSRGLYQIADEVIIKNRIKNLYETWLFEQAKIILKEKIHEFSKIIGVSPKDWQIKKLKNRWGSVTKRKKVVLNVNLIKAPQSIIDYVIAHELCHLRIEGHSHHFWNLLHKFVPDYQKKIDWLHQNSESLIS